MSLDAYDFTSEQFDDYLQFDFSSDLNQNLVNKVCFVYHNYQNCTMNIKIEGDKNHSIKILKVDNSMIKLDVSPFLNSRIQLFDKHVVVRKPLLVVSTRDLKVQNDT